MPRTSRSADADDLEIVVDARGAIERLDLGDQLVVGAAGPRGVAEHLVAGVGQPRRRRIAAISDFSLCHQQPVDQRGLVAHA